MPNKLPRLNVTVTEEQRKLLFELAELRGGSASGQVRLLLDEVTPFLRVAVPQLRRAVQEQEDVMQGLANVLSYSLDEMGAVIGATQVDIEDVLRERGAPASGKAGATRRADAGAKPSLKAVSSDG